MVVPLELTARRIAAAMAKGAQSFAPVDPNSEKVRVLQIARRVAATVGADFFQAVAKHLTGAVGANCVLIGEFTGVHIDCFRTLGGWMDGEAANFEFELAGSACAALATGRSCQYRSNARSRFPNDTLLAEVGAHAVVGIPLLDSHGRPIGGILALYRRPVVQAQTAKHLLQIFAGRAAAELSRKREEDELRESEQRYRAFISKSADAMWRVELERPIDTTLSPETQLMEMFRYGYIAECNDALAMLMGLERAEQLIGKRLEDVTPRSELQYEQANLNSIRNGYDFTTIEIVRKDARGRMRYLLRSQWGIVEDGKLVRVWGVSRDITDLRLSTHELGASERRMSRLLETMKLVAVIEDANGTITYCNNYFYERTGWTAEGVKGKSLAGLLSPPEERARLLAIFDDAGTKPEAPIHFESTLLGPEGERWRFQWDRTVLRDGGGQIGAWANIGRDLTEHSILEAQLQQAQKLATLGKVAGGVAHDFNNLLTVILGYSAQLLEDRERLDPKTLTTLEQIQKAAVKGADLTHRLLAFGRRQILKPEIFSLNSLIADSLPLLRRLIGEEVQLNTEFDPSLGLVRIDANSFHQALMNLAVNARDAMPQGGSLTIATANTTVFESESLLAAPGDYVEVTIVDTGIGMTEEVREHLFEPFFTTKGAGKGTGLGLSMVYGIVQQSGGNITVDTAPGKGTIFRLRFPSIVGEKETVSEEESLASLPRGSETILLIEDRDDLRDLTASTLRSLGYTVLEADGETRALEIALDPKRALDLLIADVPIRASNGVDVALQILDHHSGIKALYISDDSEASRAYQKAIPEACAHLQKPFTPKELATAVRRLLDV